MRVENPAVFFPSMGLSTARNPPAATPGPLVATADFGSVL